MTQKSPIFEKIYKDYLDEISKTDLKAISKKLRIQTEGDSVIIPLFGKPYTVSGKGICDSSGNTPDHSFVVILSKYLLMCPEDEPTADEWVSYKDFKDAAPFVGAFANNTERPIAERFSGKPDSLRKACENFGGVPLSAALSYDLSVRFDALPRVPMFLLFNDADDDFPAQCNLLFEKRAEAYLDMECLAMVGMMLSDYLKRR